MSLALSLSVCVTGGNEKGTWTSMNTWTYQDCHNFHLVFLLWIQFLCYHLFGCCCWCCCLASVGELCVVEKSVYVLCFISNKCIIAHWYLCVLFPPHNLRALPRSARICVCVSRDRERLTFTDTKNKSNNNGTPKQLVAFICSLTGLGRESEWKTCQRDGERETDCVIANVHSTLIFPLSGYF